MSDWRPSTAPTALRARAELYRRIRGFFAARDYLEVDPPLLGRGGTTDPAIESFRSEYVGREYYLQTSPEFFMKRLLASGSGPIYALCRVFRQGEQGCHHNPEFTMLEWYRPGFDDHDLMTEIGEFLNEILDAPIHKFTYRRVFADYLQIDPHTATLAQLKDCARRHVSVPWDDDNRDVWLDLLFSHVIQPELGKAITFVHDYPASQAALAKIVEDETGQIIARRFEVFFDGIELANGYWELTDAKEQARRFALDNDRRRAAHQSVIAADTKLIEALEHGLPDCAGVALGVDRLLMLIMGESAIDAVVAFPWQRL